MYINIATLNKISKTGISLLSDRYALTDTIEEAKGILVRSQDMNSMEFQKSGSYSQSRRRSKQHSSGPVRRERHRGIQYPGSQC